MVVALVPLVAGAAAAAAPKNDRPHGAVGLSLGQIVHQDTTEATTGSLDAKVNERCGAPAVKATVWFRYTASADGAVVIDTAKSDYPVGLMVFHGAPTPDSLFRCGPQLVAARTQAGKTYTIMAFSYTQQQGGNLALSLQAAPPPPTLSVTVHAHGQAYESGNARVSGTFTCTNAEYTFSRGELTQIWRRLKITGFFRLVTAGLCDGQPHPWTRTVNSDNGLYGAGTATVELHMAACGMLRCTRSAVTQDVTLRAPQQPSGGGTSTARLSSPVLPCADRESATMWQLGHRCKAAVDSLH